MKISSVQIVIGIIAILIIFVVSGVAYYRSGCDAGLKKGSVSGYADGYQQGKKAGNMEGYHAGYLKGRSDGYSDGMAAGRDKGYAEGSASGYSKGYSAGYSEGNSNYIYNSRFDYYDDGCCGSGAIPGNQMSADPNYFYLQGQTNR
jgi:hypothetical protein